MRHSKNKREPPTEDSETVPTKKKIKSSGEAIIPYYSKESVSLIPPEITKWILSFVTSPKDFVRLRTVCRQWNTLLGELFFGTVTATKNDLLRMVHVIQYCFEEKIPFMLTKSALKISANTTHTDCSVEMNYTVNTTGIDKEITYYFLMPTREFYDGLNRSKKTLFCFSNLAGRMVCKFSTETEDWSIILDISKSGYHTNIHSTGYAPIDMWRSQWLALGSAVVPKYSVKLGTDVGMFLSICKATSESLLRLSMYTLRDRVFDRDMLLLTLTPGNRSCNALRLDYYFIRKNESKPNQWMPLQLIDLIDIETKRGQRIAVQNDDLVFSEQYSTYSIADALSKLNPSSPIAVCIDQHDTRSLIVKYPGLYGITYKFNIRWIFKCEQ
jgi:hypothetical protein